MAFRDGNILFFDGACGTNLQRMEIPTSAWEGRDGCNEFLNVSAPEVIREWHSSFLSAGATVLETNTFGANAIVLSEYGLADRVAEINRAAVGNAREAIRKAGGAAYVAGSIGPTTKLPSLGHIAFQPMAAAPPGRGAGGPQAGGGGWWWGPRSPPRWPPSSRSPSFPSA